MGAISEGARTLNFQFFPTTETLGVGPHSTLLLGTDGITARDAALEFPIASISTIPQGAQVKSATLFLTATDAIGQSSLPGLVVSGYGDGSGVVTLPDFHLATTTPIGTTPPLPFGHVDTPLSFDVTGFIQSLANQRTPFAGFLLERGFLMGHGGLDVWGSQAPMAAEQPLLVVTFVASVPEPHPMALGLILGAVGLVAVVARRRPRAVGGGPR